MISFSIPSVLIQRPNKLSMFLCITDSTGSIPSRATYADPEGGGGGGGGTPLKNHKNIGLLSNSGPDPLKNYEANEPAFNVGPSSAYQRNAI